MTVSSASKVALVTGVVGGIGAATREAFLKAGWKVVGVDIRSGQPSTGGGNPGHDILQADMADETDSREVFRTVGEREGRLDALVNNAAVQLCKPLVETTPDEWDEVLAVNLRSVYLAVRHGHGLLRKARGSIVNVASVHAVATSPNIAAYAASKGGLVALTRALAIELAPDGIRVNAVLPGAVDTDMLAGGLQRGDLEGTSLEERREDLARRHLLRRIGRPGEVAQAILFLADSDRASFITGEGLVVDGGTLSRLSTE